MKKNRKRIDPRYFLEETAIRDDLDDSLALLEDEAAVPLPKVQIKDVEVECSSAGGRKETGQVRINPILDGGEIVEYEVSTSPQAWPGSRTCAFEAVQKVANELAEEGQRSGGPNVIDCDEDRVRIEMGYKPAGMCKVVIGNPAGQLRERGSDTAWTDDTGYHARGLRVTKRTSGGPPPTWETLYAPKADECSTDPEDENYHPMCDLYKDPKSGQKYFKIFRRPLGRLDPGSEERVSTRAAMRGKKSKLKNVKLGTPTHTEPLRVREVVEDSDLGDPLERRPGVNPVMDRLRQTAANTRGTGPYSSQSEPEAEGEVEEPADKYFGIFKLQGGHETVTAVSDSEDGIKAEFEGWNPRGPDERIAAIIHGRLIQGKTDTD